MLNIHYALGVNYFYDYEHFSYVNDSYFGPGSRDVCSASLRRTLVHDLFIQPVESHG